MTFAFMKSFSWLFTVGFVMVCLACWALSSIVVRFAFRGLGITLPEFTLLVLGTNIWVLFAPLPWLIYAFVLSCRAEVSRRAALVFATSITAATVLLVCVVIIACTPPFLAPITNIGLE